MSFKPVVLCILDGWGLREAREANAPLLAQTPNFDRVMKEMPNAALVASGEAVGLPDGQMGNSEVGHMNIGAGRIVWMDLPRINKTIADGSFEKRLPLAHTLAKVKSAKGRLHLAGLLSDGGVHAHLDHMIAAAKAATAEGVPVLIHAFLDGRDVPPSSAEGFVADLLARLPDGAEVASVSGRFYAMDRDKRWTRVEAAYRAMALGQGDRSPDAESAVRAAAARGETDEFVLPAAIGDYAGMAPGDGLFFLNFRADRAREILEALLLPEFDGFERGPAPNLSTALGMVEYSDVLNDHMTALFPSEDIPNTLGAVVASAGKSQFRLAETEKYPHVTFFFNGGVEVPNDGETRYMAPSPQVRTYDEKPEMSAEEVTDQLVAAIAGGAHDLIVVNYANPDMVGHTGDLDAAIKACEAVDAGLGRALAALEETGGAMVLTADHGNCDMMTDPETGGPHTAHTLAPVPIAIIGGPAGATVRAGGILADLAPTVLDLMGIDQPADMTGRSLIG